MTGLSGQRAVTEAPDVSEDGRTLEGIVCAYGVRDTHGTSWRRGVFNESLRSSSPVALCWAHDHKQIVGKMTNWEDRSEGLWARFRLADPAAVPEARKAQSLLKDGMVRGLSVGFDKGVTGPDPRLRGVRQFTSAQLGEVSIVLRPSVPGSRVLALRSQQRRDQMPLEIQARLALMRR